MPIKELQFSFSISVEDLARALATSNSGMKVQVLGSEPEQLPNGHAVKALPPPKRNLRHILLTYLRSRPDRTITTKELAAYAETYGFNPQAVHNATHNMHRDGLIRRYKPGMFRISKAGLTHGE